MANVYVRSGAGGAGTGADWANAFTTLAAALAAKAAGDDFFVSEDHNPAALASGIAHASPGTAAAPCRIFCVDHNGSVPPVSADLRTTATIATSGSNSITYTGFVSYCYGISFTAGDGAGSASHTNTGTWRWYSCNFICGGTNSGSQIRPANNSTARGLWVNCNIQVAAIATSVTILNGTFEWRGGTINGATIPTVIIAFTNGIALIEGVDFTPAGAGKSLVTMATAAAYCRLKDCEYSSAAAVAVTPTAPAGIIDVVRTDSGNTGYKLERYLYQGTMLTDTSVVRTGGASDGSNKVSWKFTNTANSKFELPFEAPPARIWNDSTSAINAAVEGVWLQSALPKNDDVWVEWEYQGESTSSLGVFKSGAKADPLATGANLTASSAAWDTAATARANNTAYTANQIVKSAANPGRIFYCGSSGTSTSAEPGGYASAVDGSSVADGSASFIAAVRFSQQVALSSPAPSLAGYLYGYVKTAKASAIAYVDPLIGRST